MKKDGQKSDKEKDRGYVWELHLLSWLPRAPGPVRSEETEKTSLDKYPAPNFLKSFVNLLVTDSLANLSKVLRGNKN